MNGKNLIRVAVVVGVLAWPTTETVRYLNAKKQLAASVTLKESVMAKLDAARVKYAKAETETAALQ